MADFVLLMTDWYRLNKRLLPWRETTNPYFIWLSEVILQQTRVDQGMSYYLNFTSTFPTVFDLANASEDEVLKLWQGLGYYSRARNLHSSAKDIVSKYDGVFPSSHSEILNLRGVGPYTAAAISSICFNQAHAVIDGNVYRILSRYFGIDDATDSSTGKKKFQLLADSLITKDNPGEYNQAIMEFGAIQCKPVNPDCNSCVLSASCSSAFNKQLISSRPCKKQKTKQQKRYFHYFVANDNNSWALVKRNETDIWANLYEFPMFETNHPHSSFDPNAVLLFQTKHILSHQIIEASFYRVKNLELIDVSYQMVTNEKFHLLPMHRLMTKFLDYASKNNLI